MQLAASAIAPAPAAATRSGKRTVAWAFTVLNSLRVLGYLPTLFAIHGSGQADQHSLLTWLTFFGANLTMAMWLYDENGRRIDRAIAVNACNALMCGAISGLIGWTRLAAAW
jgi:hypothetical protein